MSRIKLVFLVIAIVLFAPLIYITLSPRGVVTTSTSSVADEYITSYQENLITSAKSACLISENRVLASKNMKEKLPMASTTKIATAITAIIYGGNLDEMFMVDKKCIGVEGTSLYLKEGEVFSLRSLLYALMLISGNDASVAIGIEVGKRNLEAEEQISPYEKFLMLMNDTAKKFGATNTHFDNTHGLDSATHYTTAFDLAQITYHALENATFKEIVSTKNTKITNGAGQVRYLKNKNKLLSQMDDCVGVKTGYTSKAGRCLVSAVENDNGRFVYVVLNCKPMFEESLKALQSVCKKYKTVKLSEHILVPNCVAVKKARVQEVQVSLEKDKMLSLSDEEIQALSIKTNLCESITGSSEKGKTVGKCEVYLNKCLIFSSDIVTIDDVKPQTILQKIRGIVTGQ